MTKPFFRMEMIIDNEAVANGAGVWFQNKVDEFGKAEFAGDGVVNVSPVFDGVEGESNGEFRVGFDVRFLVSVSRDTILDAIKSKAQEAGVVGNIVSFKCWKHECTHEDSVPLPCTNVLMFEYSRD